MRDRVCAAALAAAALGGCGADPAPARFDPATTISYGSVGTRAEIDCAGKTLAVGGSNNTLRVRGTCASVIVDGSDNRITLAGVDSEVRVSGVNNTVGFAGGDPVVTDTGTGNRIGRG